MENEYNLILTGFMGTGKTTIGEIVAAKLGRKFVDTDHIIMERLGKTVPEIFAAYGEPFFRALEASVCAELGKAQSLVVSTGGGALVRFENLRAIAGFGNIVICLNAEPDVILQRLANDTRKRPLVDKDNHQDRREAIRNLLESRRAAYKRIRLQVDTSRLSVDEVVKEVLRIFEYESARNAIRLPVYSPTNRYTVLCDNGLLDDIAEWLRSYNLQGRTMVVTSANLAALYGEKVANALPDAALITMPDGEQHKNLDTVRQLYRDFAAAGLDRSGIVLALGGGVVGDTVGFAAATYMRGVNVVQVPTTLLAMVDSSVGGKVGVDIPEGKNLVGAFKQPELVVIDPNVLKTLPHIEIQCGLVEAIKHGLLADPELLECMDSIAAGDSAALRRAIQVKVDIVQRDPYESGERAHLNLGHTFGHAIERVSGYSWRHGEAVSVGLVAAARLSERLGRLTPEKAGYMIEMVKRIGLPTTIKGYNSQALWEAMHTDKKWMAGHSRFIILEDFGKPKIIEDVPREVVIEVLEGLGAV